ncbi:hypothetical protein Sant_2844 [Sodalis praecaptivus]|uniref:Uncharacterized protein n=2 Tax=Sodalis TaxID=84565 RepID=W0HVQ8_9GAMM|nr:hypothetical protein [Sodalis praecaptivus]AHF77859.1 hypothetical protein Sant_2844 [Sodalis praecaptivus]
MRGFTGMLKSVGHGRHSLSKWTQAIAFLTCTGVICWYSYHLRLSEWMFGLYFGVAVGANVLNKKIAMDKALEDKRVDVASVVADACQPAGENQ